MRLVLLLVCAALHAASALRLGVAARAPPRALSPTCEERVDAKTCAMITLSPEDPLRLAKVLKKAWMEGGVKRGLVGTVLVGQDCVQIAAQGPQQRLKSFAEWIETSSMLVTDVQMMDPDSCPASELSAKFPLADAENWSGAVAGSFAGDLADQLKTLAMEIETKRGTTHSNDEGLF